MVNISLTNYKIIKIDMLNNIEHPELVDTKNTFNYEVNYNNNATKAVATLSEKIFSPENPDKLHINITIQGEFSLNKAETGNDRRQVHVMCYEKLFPYASQIVSQIAANSGLIGLMLKRVEMKEEDVRFVSGSDTLT